MMPILARYRQAYEKITIPLGRVCMRLGLTPDMLTLMSLAIGGIAAYLIGNDAFIWGIIFILLMSAADVLDGATARASGTSSPFGTVLDHVSDRYAEFFIMLGIAVSGVVSPGWAMFTLFGMVIASYVRARAESTGLVESCNVGFAGRQEKLTLLCIGMGVEQVYPGHQILLWAVIICGVLSHITAIQRVLYTRRVILGPDGRRPIPKHQEPA